MTSVNNHLLEGAHKSIVGKFHKTTPLAKWHGTLIGCRVLTALLVVYTATTTFTHVYLSILEAGRNATAAVTVAALAVAIIEGVKLSIVPHTIRAIVTGWWNDSFITVMATALLLVTAGTMLFLSWTMSVQGTPIIAALLSKQVAQQKDTAPIDAQIQGIAAQRGELLSHSRWRGNITAPAIKEAGRLQMAIDSLQARRAAAVQTTANFSATFGGYMKAFSGVAECLTILLLLVATLLGYHHFIASDGTNPAPIAAAPPYPTPAPLPVNPPPTTGAGPAPKAEARKPMGFHPTYVDQRFQPIETTAESPDILKLAYKHAKANLQSWEAKKRNGTGTAETNAANIEKWSATMAEIQKQMK